MDRPASRSNGCFGSEILLYLKRAFLIFAAAVACNRLAEQFGGWNALLKWAGAMALACFLGALLLRSSGVGRITWRNRLASYLNPFGWRLNRGRLWPIPVLSWLVWMGIGATVMLLRTRSETIGFRIALFAAWVIDASALVHVLGTTLQAPPGSRPASLKKLIVLIVGLIVASFGLYLAGMTTAALVVAGGPPLVVGTGLGLFVLAFMTLGRNTRWN